MLKSMFESSNLKKPQRYFEMEYKWNEDVHTCVCFCVFTCVAGVFSQTPFNQQSNDWAVALNILLLNERDICPQNHKKWGKISVRYCG